MKWPWNNLTSPRPSHRASGRDGGGRPTRYCGTSEKLRPMQNAKFVPPPLRVAMAHLNTGDFIFDPDGGR
jgi:hypothetical protein